MTDVMKNDVSCANSAIWSTYYITLSFCANADDLYLIVSSFVCFFLNASVISMDY